MGTLFYSTHVKVFLCSHQGHVRISSMFFLFVSILSFSTCTFFYHFSLFLFLSHEIFFFLSLILSLFFHYHACLILSLSFLSFLFFFMRAIRLFLIDLSFNFFVNFQSALLLRLFFHLVLHNAHKPSNLRPSNFIVRTSTSAAEVPRKNFH